MLDLPYRHLRLDILTSILSKTLVNSLCTTGRPALELLKEGLRDLRDLCDILESRVEQNIPDAEVNI